MITGYIVRTKERTIQEIKEYHLKRLEQLALNHIGDIPQLDEPTEQQLEWVKHRMKGSARSWERWFVGQYFTEEQKKELRLTDEDIAGRGIR